jgi:hypothetical protein
MRNQKRFKTDGVTIFTTLKLILLKQKLLISFIAQIKRYRIKISIVDVKPQTN